MPILKANASKGNVAETIAYVLDQAKTTGKVLLNMNAEENYAKQMERTARMWNKDKPGSRQFYHFKLAFHPDDSKGGPLDDWMALQIGTKLTKQFFPGYQAVLSVHNDTAHKHVHIIVGAVHPTTGRKISINDAAYRRMKDRVDELSAEYGLTTVGWREAVRKKRREETLTGLPVKHCFAEEGLHRQGKGTWKDELRNMITGAVVESESMGEFREKLAERDVVLARCTDKCITYRFKDYPPVRGDTLGSDFTFASVMSTIRYNNEWPDEHIGPKDIELYRSWGRAAAMNRSEIDAIVEELPRATWSQKQDVWAIYRESKEMFWTEYRRRRELLRGEMDEAYRHRRLIKDAQWLLDPRNKNRCLAGIVFGAIIMHRYGNREYIEGRIRDLRGRMELLRKESVEFRNQSEAAILNLRQRELTLEQYLAEVRQMQELAEGMFCQPSQQAAIFWALEQRARVKAPTLEEYLKMCESEQNGQEEKENEKELCH